MIKKYLLTAIILLFAYVVYAQDKVQDNFGVNLQLFGAGVNYEFAVGQNFTINTLVTYEGGFFQGLDGDVNYLLTTTFGAEPRWYYNRKRRSDLGKNVNYNVGNFIAGELFYAPDLLSSSTDNNVAVDPSFAIGIKYGLRRKVVEKLHFEISFGIGQVFPTDTDSFTAPLLDIKLQYVLF